MDFRTIAVLGGGAGARALAADLALQGCAVRMWDLPQFFTALTCLQQEPTLTATGVIQGQAALELVSGNLEMVVRDADFICVVTQALAHAQIAEALAPIVTADQCILGNPGSSGGAVEFARVLHDRTAAKPVIAETSTLTHTCRIVSNREVLIRMRVGLVKMAALPASSTERVLGSLRSLLPGLRPARDVLETMLCNGNPIIHPTVMLLNTGTVERSGGRWQFYEEGFTPSVAAVVETLDAERIALGRALGLELLPEPEMSYRLGYSTHTDYLRAYRDGPGFQGLGGPDAMSHRYITEDVACALVTLLELGQVCGGPMPVAAAIAQLASTVSERDYVREARRGLRSLGLADLTPEQMLRFVQQGQCD